MKPGEAGLLPEGVRQRLVLRWNQGRTEAHADCLAEEVPVALVFNGLSHAVMMASPADLEDFALGFALSEGLLQGADELYGTEVQAACAGIEVHLQVSSRSFMALKERRRNLAGRTGCGLCGTESLDHVRRELPPLPATAVTAAALALAQGSLCQWQVLQQLTGATHAAAWCALDGQVQLLREDVGRHNALDKLIGAMVRADVSPRQGFIAITSRASFEMVQKTAMAGVGLLAAVSAPTVLAVDLAEQAGLALAGFVRDDGFVAYTFADRFGLTIESTPHGK